MHSNVTNGKLIHPELSYKLTGLFFEVHNNVGRFGREKQYCDFLESILRRESIKYEREKNIPIVNISNEHTNRADFIIDEKILIEMKAKPMILKEDYVQIQRYLQASGYKLGLLVNFRNRYLKPIRIIRINS